VLKISNYKMLSNLECPTGNFNLITGGNQSGCTSILQALMLLCLGANPLVVQSVGLPKDHGVNYRTSFKIPNLFHKNNFKKPITITLDKQRLQIKSVTPHSYEVKLNDNTNLYDLKLPFPEEKEITNIPLGRVFGVEQNPSELSYYLDYLFQNNGEVDDDFLVMLNKVVKLHHYTDNGKPLHCMQMGLSAIRVVQIAVEVLRAKNGILLIDDIEMGLDSTTISKLMEMLFFASKKYNIQVFATSHNPTAIMSEIDGSQFALVGVNLKNLIYNIT